MMPKRVKYRKVQRGRTTGKAKRGTEVRWEIMGFRPLIRFEVAREALRLASHKLPVKTRFLAREGTGGEVGEN